MVVLYRKYRPQKIGEVDSTLVREKLESILSSGRMPHAFLFSGPKGTGKTSAARIISKSVNCEKNNGRGEPCGKCHLCVSITNGTNLDVLEIDAASNRGIDEIRELRDKIRLAPAGARYKVYIIDEVHMLTTEAFNALLKTLEEPPEHAIFVLCTTIPEKLPETIISRCTRIDFGRAQIADIIQSLKRAKKGEKREIDKEALAEIASLSEGSYRDAHKLLEQVLIAYPRAKITVEMVKKTLGDKQVPGNIFEWMVTHDAKSGLATVGAMIEEGVDFKFLTQSILETLHCHLLKKYGIIKENFSYHEKLNNLSPEELKHLISLISKASQELKTTAIPQLPLELAIVEWCEEERNEAEPSAFQPATSVSSTLSPRHSTLFSSQGGVRVALEKGDAHLLNEIEKRWEEVLAAVKPHNHSVAGLLRSCRPVSFDGRELTLEVFYKFHFERLNEPKVRELLEKVVQDLLGKKIKIFPKLRVRKEG